MCVPLSIVTTYTSVDNGVFEKVPIDAFKLSIQQFVSAMENEPKAKCSINKIRERFQFQRRRLYDVLNVLESIGCCLKTGVDTILWLGFNNIKPALTKLTAENHVFDEDASIDDVIKNDPSISISKLTQQFLLSFFALDEHYLNIKAISHYIARLNGRYKSTLCKLYQISHILESSGIIEKADSPGLIHLKDQYYVKRIAKNDNTHDASYCLSIENLLNRCEPKNDYLLERKKEFLSIWQKDKSAYIPFTAPNMNSLIVC